MVFGLWTKNNDLWTKNIRRTNNHGIHGTNNNLLNINNMKKSLLLTSMFALGLGLVSCSSEEPYVPQADDMAGAGQTLSFSLRMPSGEKVSYTRADGDPIHDESEWTINRLALYEYEVIEDADTLIRVIKSDGPGKNVLDPVRQSDNSYDVAIIVPNDYMGRKFRYRFVANDNTVDPAAGSQFATITGQAGDGSDDIPGLRDFRAAHTILEGNTADVLSRNGIAMSGTALNGADEVIVMDRDLSCSVAMQRIVSRIDIRYATPNLKVTAVELRNAPKYGFLFDRNGDGSAPAIDAADCLTLGRNTDTPLPTGFLRDLKDEEGTPLGQFAMNKAFYLYERSNMEGNSATVHIEYDVDYNGKTEVITDEEGEPVTDAEGNEQTRPVYYHGSIDVPFSTKEGYVDALRNHRYTIVLGDGDKPVSGAVKVNLTVKEWNDVVIDELLTPKDPKVE